MGVIGGPEGSPGYDADVPLDMSHKGRDEKPVTLVVDPPSVVHVFRGVYAEQVRSLVQQYSEWLDVEKINPGTADNLDHRTHDELVTEFLASRNSQATPRLEP